MAQFARIDDDLAQRWNDVLFDLKARRHDRGRGKKKKKNTLTSWIFIPELYPLIGWNRVIDNRDDS